MRIRKNVASLTAAELASLERGIAIMKQRPKAWPTSWAFQANMHGFLLAEEPVVYRGWGGCQHGNWWFLPWHRMYLYYFEQILRDAAGDPSLSLPYWDWTNPDQRSLPEPFLDPNSPLYEANRSPDMNERGELSESVVRWEVALAEIPFSTPYVQHGFGGQFEPRPGAYKPHGALESLAHDGVHTLVGGLMGDPDTAARDPIFWLHHANIDRLWGVWLREQAGRYNPDDPLWLDTTFDFYGRTGSWGQATPRPFLDTVSLKYPYRYDTDPASPPIVLAQGAQGAVPAPPRVAVARAREKQPVTLAVQAPQRRELGSEPVSVSLTLSPEPRRQLERVFAAPPGVEAPGVMPPMAEQPIVRIAIDDIQFTASPGRIYEIYLNLPDPSEATGPKSPYFAGIISFFGLHARHNGQAMAPMGGATQEVDVTETVKRLGAQGKLQGDLKITLIERTAKAKPRPGIVGAPPRATPPPKVSIGAIRLLKVGE